MNLEIKKLTIHVDQKKDALIHNLDVLIPWNQKVAITGNSGSGKSSFLYFLLGFLESTHEGRLFADGKCIENAGYLEFRKHTAWLPQDLSLQIETVKDLLLYPFSFSRNKALRPSGDEIQNLLSTFQLDDSIIKKNTAQISGGEKQRVLLIATLLQKKPIILLDEPSSSLDKDVSKIVADYFNGLENQTVIAATHDQYWMDQADSVINMDKK